MMRKYWLVAPILVGIVALSLASPAQAQFRMRLDTGPPGPGGGPGVVITDNGVGDLNPLVGAIVVSTTLPGGWTVNVTTGVSKPLIGGVNSFAELDLNSINVQTSGPGTLRIFLEDNGYTGGPDGGLVVIGSYGGVLTAQAGSSITFQSWANGTNAVPAYGPNVFPAGAVAALASGAVPAGSVPVFPDNDPTTPLSGRTEGPGPFSFSSSASFVRTPPNGPYSLFAEVDIVFTSAGSVSFNEIQQVVPAPGGLVLLLSGAPLAGIAYLRRRFKAKK